MPSLTLYQVLLSACCVQVDDLLDDTEDEMEPLGTAERRIPSGVLKTRSAKRKSPEAVGPNRPDSMPVIAGTSSPNLSTSSF